MIRFQNVHLDDSQIAALSGGDPKAWFTAVEFANASSPRHPQGRWLEKNNATKLEMVGDWVREYAPGRDVFDSFCANGAFAFRAAMAGATSVTGMDFDEERVRAARLVADFVGDDLDADLDFRVGDVYHVDEAFSRTFDVTLALGGLYHIADPPYVLRMLGGLTRRWLILQTAHLIPLPGNFARFRVRRRDRRKEGLSSIRAGRGVWYYTAGCLREMLAHGGFEVVDERVRYWRGRLASPWYAALARPVE